MKEYHEIPQPHEISTREKEDAMGAYLMMFASMGVGLPLPIINLIAAIVYYFINKSKSLFVHFHSLQSVISQLPTSIINAIGVGWAIRIYLLDYELTDLFKGYVAMAVVLNIAYFIFSIVGAIKARKGRMYYFLFFGRLSYEWVFAKKETETKEIVNLPPK